MKLVFAMGRVENRATWIISGANENQLIWFGIWMFTHFISVLWDNRYSKKVERDENGSLTFNLGSTRLNVK